MRTNKASSGIRSISVLLTVSLLLSLLFTTSCAKKSSEITYNGEQSYSFEKEMWLDTPSFLRALNAITGDPDATVNINITDAFNSGSGYTFLWNEGSDVYVSSIDYDGNAIGSSCVSKGFSGDPVKAFACSDGSLLVIFMERNSKDLTYKYSYVRIDQTGKVVQDQTALPISEQFQAISWDMDSKNNLYILGDNDKLKVQSILSLSSSLAFRYEMNLPEGMYPTSLAVTSQDGLYVSLFRDSNQVELVKVNKDSGKIDQNLVFKGLTGTEIQLYGVRNGVSDGLVIDTGDKLVTFDPSSNRLAIYLSYVMEGISRVGGVPVLFASGNTILLPGSLENAAQANPDISAGLIRLVGTKASGDRTTLTVGVMTAEDSGMLAQNVYLFNNSQTKYRIEVKAYIDTTGITDTESWQNALNEGQKRMKADLLGADTPDLICLSQKDAGDYAEQGMLLDLNTLIAGDSSFDESDYLTNIWEAQENDGHRYTIAPFFSISGIIGSDEVLGDISGWTVEEFEAVLAREKGWQHIFYDDDRQTMFGRLYPAIADSYIDFNSDTGVAEFHPEELLKYFSLIEKYSNELQDADQSVMEQTKSGTTLFMDAGISTFENYPNLMEFYSGKITGTGYPGAEAEGPLISSTDYYGISQNSSQRDGAWMFLKFLLSDTVQGNSDPSVTQGMPIQVQAFDNMIEWGSERYENGTSITLVFQSKAEVDAVMQEIAEVMAAAGCLLTDVQAPGERTEITPEVIQDFRDLIGKAARYENVDQEMYEMIREESEYYFSGSKTKEEVEALIENRVKVYLEEKG